MALRGHAPEKVQKRLKMMMFGEAGVGKTTTALQFPRPYYIDPERGAENDEYVERLKKSKGAYLHTTDTNVLFEEVMALIQEKHDYRTLVIDPLTIFYNDLLDTSADKIGTTDYGKHKAGPDRRMRHLFRLMMRLDMNVIITSHARPKWVRSKDASGRDTLAQEGFRADCYDKFQYMFDLVVFVAKRGKERVGIVDKTRLTAFPEGDVFTFSYEEVARRVGKNNLERDCVPVLLATPEQVAEITALLEERKNGEELAEKWLKKGGAEDWSEMPTDAVQKCIEHLKGKPID